MIGCPADYNCPMNLHINNRQGSNDEVVERFMQNMLDLAIIAVIVLLLKTTINLIVGL